MAVQTQSVRPWPPTGEAFYPETDGKPMAENTKQYRWIVLLIENIRDLFAHDPNVFVAGDLFWYPVEGRPDISLAPDCMVAFGRPQGDRRSYKQWEENGVAPQVVFEVLAPSNTAAEMREKLAAFERYGVQEVYYYDPEKHELRAWLRRGDRLEPVETVDGFQSPRLKIRFWPTADEMKVERPDGTAFESFAELSGRAEQAQRRAAVAEAHADRLAARLRSLGIDPEQA
ncbi:MAG: Uma2 family endonuclease [Verrucomicrobia bacterium]|nr:Uma2 family endonuclease [Verrucomicrobiota bacterium]